MGKGDPDDWWKEEPEYSSYVRGLIVGALLLGLLWVFGLKGWWYGIAWAAGMVVLIRYRWITSARREKYLESFERKAKSLSESPSDSDQVCTSQELAFSENPSDTEEVSTTQDLALSGSPADTEQISTTQELGRTTSRDQRTMLQKLGWDALCTAFGLLVSAKLLPGVSLDLEGLVVATAVIVVPMVVLDAMLGKPGDTDFGFSVLIALVLIPVWLVAAVPVADHATSGFDIDGFWPTVGTIVILVVASIPFALIHQLLRPRRD